MIIQEFSHYFRGEANLVPSRCHVRVLAGEGKPLVVVYSQGAYHGTSIQNAAEQVIGEIRERLAADEKYAGKIEETLWIEHWTAKGSISDTARYSIIVFDDDGGVIDWSPTSTANLSKKTGYSETELIVPDEKVDALAFNSVESEPS